MNKKTTKLVVVLASLSMSLAFTNVVQTSLACDGSESGCPSYSQNKSTLALHEDSTNEGQSKLTTSEIKVPTIVCGMCVKTVTKAVTSIEGVTKVSVDKKAKVATVTFDPEKTNLEKIEIAITKAGYAAGDKPADISAFGKLAPCCQAK